MKSVEIGATQTSQMYEHEGGCTKVCCSLWIHIPCTKNKTCKLGRLLDFFGISNIIFINAFIYDRDLKI